MTTHRWAGGIIPAELGVIVHGPRILGRADGIATGLRCIFAHTGGLHLVVTLHATGVRAEAASRQSFDHPSPDDTGRRRHSAPAVQLDLDGLTGEADPSQTTASGGEDVFDMEASFWVDRIPADGRLAITVAWPQAGLPETRSQLTLEGLADQASRPLPLT